MLLSASEVADSTVVKVPEVMLVASSVMEEVVVVEYVTAVASPFVVTGPTGSVVAGCSDVIVVGAAEVVVGSLEVVGSLVATVVVAGGSDIDAVVDTSSVVVAAKVVVACVCGGVEVAAVDTGSVSVVVSGVELVVGGCVVQVVGSVEGIVVVGGSVRTSNQMQYLYNTIAI